MRSVEFKRRGPLAHISHGLVVGRIEAEGVIRRFKPVRADCIHDDHPSQDSTGDAALEPQTADYAFGSNPPYALLSIRTV